MPSADAEKYSRGGVEGWLLERFRRRLVAVATGGGPASVLDAGCGEGFVTGWLRDALPGVRMVGIDPRHDALGQAARRVPDASFHAADVLDLPYPDGSFDLVVCTEVLEHVADPGAALAELRRVARDRVLLTVPHEPFFRTGNLLRGRHVRRLGSTPGHRWTWSRAALLRLVRTGTDAVRWRSLFPWQCVTVSARSRATPASPDCD